MNLRSATALAEKITDILRPLCQRIEIAGSIRRARPECNDIDLVLLADNPAAVLQRCRMHSQPVTDGPQIAIFRLTNGVQLDLYFARGPLPDLLDPKPTNWGSILLCRTGSKEHNIYLCQRALAMGLKWETTTGIKDPDGYLLAAETEKDIYECLGFPYLAPNIRELDYLQTHFGKPGKIKQETAEVAEKTPSANSAASCKSDPIAAGRALEQFQKLKHSLEQEIADEADREQAAP